MNLNSQKKQNAVTHTKQLKKTDRKHLNLAPVLFFFTQEEKLGESVTKKVSNNANNSRRCMKNK